MRHRTLLPLVGLALFPFTVYLGAADKIDPRLAGVRKAWIEPVDPLADDQRVAQCVVERIAQQTALAAAESKEMADVVLRVSAHITSGAKRVMLGSMGGTPSAHMEATLPDGTSLWNDGAKYRRGNGAIGLANDARCGLAEGLLKALREAMLTARDGK